jgi:hypothetical protein
MKALNELMRRCREDGYTPTYQDLIELHNALSKQSESYVLPTRIRALLQTEMYQSGLTAVRLGNLLGRTRAEIYQVLTGPRMPDAYIADWKISRGKNEPVWRCAPVPKNVPPPNGHTHDRDHTSAVGVTPQDQTRQTA